MTNVRSSPRRRSARAWPLLLAVVLAGCAGKGDPGVGVKGLDADIAFGIKRPDNTDKTTVADVVNEQVDTSIGANTEVAIEPIGPEGKKRLGPALRPSVSCPKAGPAAFPEAPASAEVAGPPQSGTYRWKRGGTYDLTSLPGQIFPYSGFEQRLITDVKRVSEATNPADGKPNLTFTYNTTEPISGTTSTFIRSYQVRTNVEGQREVNVQTGPRARAGAPDRGLVLTAVAEQGPRGANDRTETIYSPGLLLLPLPVSPGEDFASVAVATKGGSLQLQGKVIGKERIDACGEIIEGWKVDATITDENNQVRQETYFVATQLGAVIIYNKQDFRDTTGHKMPEFSRGQLRPSPLPEGAQP
jgi:hypothetical protein